MNMRIFSYIFILYLAMTNFCWANETPEKGWNRQLVAEFISAPHENLSDFLRVVGVHLHEFTKANGHEACGAIAHNGERYSVKLYTDGVPHGCAIHTNEVVDGFSFVGETIHSHPWQKILVMTSQAKSWSRFYKDGNHNAPTLRNDGAGGFSRADHAIGQGWLVAGGKLLYLSNGKSKSYFSLTDK